MKIYPIRVPRDRYTGRQEARRRKAAEFNRDAVTLERYLNERIEADPDPIQRFIYGFIAPDVGMTTDRVRDILFAVDCGHNGLIVAKSEAAYRDRMGSSETQ